MATLADQVKRFAAKLPLYFDTDLKPLLSRDGDARWWPDWDLTMRHGYHSRAFTIQDYAREHGQALALRIGGNLAVLYFMDGSKLRKRTLKVRDGSDPERHKLPDTAESARKVLKEMCKPECIPNIDRARAYRDPYVAGVWAFRAVNPDDTCGEGPDAIVYLAGHQDGTTGSMRERHDFECCVVNWNSFGYDSPWWGRS